MNHNDSPPIVEVVRHDESASEYQFPIHDLTVEDRVRKLENRLNRRDQNDENSRLSAFGTQRALTHSRQAGSSPHSFRRNQMNTSKHFIVALLTASFALPALADSTRDYRPPDQFIEFDVKDEIRSMFRLDSPNIEARVLNGEVTLRGEVPSFRDRMELERRIAEIEGVRRVTNWLRVERLTIEQRSTARVAKPNTVTTQVSLNAATKTIRGTIQVKADDRLVVRDFYHGSVEATVTESSDIKLDGKQVDVDALSEGLLVFIEAMQQNGELIAQSVEAHSPK